MRPGDHMNATGDHMNATSDHMNATGDHMNATRDHVNATGDHMNVTGDHMNLIHGHIQRESPPGDRLRRPHGDANRVVASSLGRLRLRSLASFTLRGTYSHDD